MKFLALAGALALLFTTTPADARIYPMPPAWWVQQAMCVHRYEGSWTDSGAPYWGGMQMDLSFQKTYGRWHYRHLGTADRWPVRAQLRVAYRGWRDRGWSPWPNTARACGLL